MVHWNPFEEPPTWDQILPKLLQCSSPSSSLRWDDLKSVFALQCNEQPAHEMVTFLKTVLPGIAGKESDSDSHAYFLSTTLPGLFSWASQFPILFPQGIPLLTSNSDCQITFSREQKNSFPINNFRAMFQKSARQQQECAKLLAVLNYFDRVSAPDFPLAGKIVIHRLVVDKVPQFCESTKPLIPAAAFLQGTIEDEVGSVLQADFANKYIGGGVLVGGCVQEEILFAFWTELLVSCIVCEVMSDNESIFISGAQEFSRHCGYAFSLRYNGNNPVDPKYEDDGVSVKSYIVAMDAVNYRHKGAHTQYLESGFGREALKAYAAFLHGSRIALPVSTGNWGCGAFCGDPYHKSMIQLLAASEAECSDFRYYTFGEERLNLLLQETFNFFAKKQKTVKWLWSALRSYGKGEQRKVDFLSYLLQQS